MKLNNDFKEEDRYLFLYKLECDICGQNNWDALHHILGRVSSSILNASTVHNFKCHVGNGKLSQFEAKKKLLKKTLDFLIESGYVLTKKDKKFKLKYQKYFE